MAGARWDSPAVAGRAFRPVRSLTEALTAAEKQAMSLAAASLPSHRLCQPLSLSMSHTAHRPGFFRKLFFPFLLSMETQNSNQKKGKKETKKPRPVSPPAEPSSGGAVQ